jgi:lysyl-tRNA synthetase, class II
MSEEIVPGGNEEIENLSEILKIRRQKLADLQNEGRDPFSITRFEKSHQSGEIISGFEKLEGSEVSLAGRILSKRIMGKASFSHIADNDGRIQIYIRKDEIGEEAYEAYKDYDIGDIIGLTGEVFKTHSGEISVKALKLVLLAKSLQPLPEKWHGLKDTDLRYRQRYVDLIVNPEIKRTFLLRSKIIKCMRDHLDSQGFIEVETPILHNTAGGANARPFITHHNTLDIDMYLRIATELHLKRLIVGGFEKVYEIGRIFRNEGMSIKHNPEFTTIELYQAYTDCEGMMDLTEDLIVHIASEILGTTEIEYQGTLVSLAHPWQRTPMLEAVKNATGVDFEPLTDEEARQQAEKLGVEMGKKATRGETLYAAFERFVESNLTQPTFITGYPVEVSPLAKRMKDKPWLTERFELFITGREMANAFSELNDPIDQTTALPPRPRRANRGTTRRT